jgi:hypothetical protein
METKKKPELLPGFSKFLDRRIHQGFFIGIVIAICDYFQLGITGAVLFLLLAFYFSSINVKTLEQLSSIMERNSKEMRKVYEKLSNIFVDIGLFIPSLSLVLFGILDFRGWHAIMAVVTCYTFVRYTHLSKEMNRLLAENEKKKDKG